MRNYQQFENPGLSTSPTPKAPSRGMHIMLDALRLIAKFCDQTLQNSSIRRWKCRLPLGTCINRTSFIPDVPRVVPIWISPVAILHLIPSVHIEHLVRPRCEVMTFIPSIAPPEKRRIPSFASPGPPWMSAHLDRRALLGFSVGPSILPMKISSPFPVRTS